MPNESELKAEIGHVLLIDIVGYSKLHQSTGRIAVNPQANGAGNGAGITRTK
jgi:hypothetical protein